MNLPVLNLLLD